MRCIKASGSQEGNQATVQLAENLRTLVQHMRQEQQMVRDWAEGQSDQRQEIRELLERLSITTVSEGRR